MLEAFVVEERPADLAGIRCRRKLFPRRRDSGSRAGPRARLGGLTRRGRKKKISLGRRAWHWGPSAAMRVMSPHIERAHRPGPRRCRGTGTICASVDLASWFRGRNVGC